MTQQEKLLLIGIGNCYRGDDGAGVFAVKRLQGRLDECVEYAEASGEGSRLMELWKGRRNVIIFDAVSSRQPAGTIHRFNASQEKVPAKFFRYSTHAFSLAEAVELARTLNQLPENLKIYGIEGKNYEAGSDVSPEVEAAIWAVCEEVKTLCMNFLSSKI